MTIKKFEIEIEIDDALIPKGYEALRVAIPKKGEDFIHLSRLAEENLCLIVRKKAQKYDWTKVDDDVLVKPKEMYGGLYKKKDAKYFKFVLAEGVIQHNTLGTCPVDPDLTFIAVRRKNGSSLIYETGIARDFNWGNNYEYPIIAWEFISLVDGAEW